MSVDDRTRAQVEFDARMDIMFAVMRYCLVAMGAPESSQLNSTDEIVLRRVMETHRPKGSQ